eukprot:5332473-Prymnesium_polylepis.1
MADYYPDMIHHTDVRACTRMPRESGARCACSSTALPLPRTQVINAPPFFAVCWAAVRPFLPPDFVRAVKLSSGVDTGECVELTALLPAEARRERLRHQRTGWGVRAWRPGPLPSVQWPPVQLPAVPLPDFRAPQLPPLPAGAQLAAIQLPALPTALTLP